MTTSFNNNTNCLQTEEDYFGLFKTPEFYLPLDAFYSLIKFPAIHDKNLNNEINSAMNDLLLDENLSDEAKKEIQQWQEKTIENKPKTIDDEIDIMYRKLIETENQRNGKSS